eukprot:CAMPEP_0170515642 /NCGR_PEP_ID=MMETSP0209-20121228/2055_1 /TAXON_ID=665100 ORGANISM="Litonotus pictus, Strain P1" /NCGR_SAMPLE_ID=MMETSP0209 /ASSEMBLY_ACC=CAM_ASM_000301 /LENGTH=154 /DNA_ID=CAMNT_0010800225 /DNA_START=234 /DNA_END=699 /DNA_ORIENTATION=+
MEHFETHVEKVQDIFDEITEKGFEVTFQEQMEAGLYSDFPKEKTAGEKEFEDWSKDLKAEFSEWMLYHQEQNRKVNNFDYSLETRKAILENPPRRKYPGTPFNFLKELPLSSSHEVIEHESYVPSLSNPDKSKELKAKKEEKEKKKSSGFVDLG